MTKTEYPGKNGKNKKKKKLSVFVTPK